jgi:4-amino-4-deoxy-L-arabinose transferase-like glycosyltransferase
MTHILLKPRRTILALAALLLLTAVLLVVRLDSVPTPWFDEGWAFSIARNWVEAGHYGRLLLGQPVPPGMYNTGLPAIGPIALSFQLFGVGILQGRLPGVLYAAGAIILLFALAREISDYRVAWTTLFVVIFMNAARDLHPALVGRQAIGEMPTAFYLLAAFVSLLAAWRRRFFAGFAGVCFALAVSTKLHALPFVALALIVPLGVAWRRRDLISARVFLFSGLASVVALMVLRILQQRIIGSDTAIEVGRQWLSVVAFAPILWLRLLILVLALPFALPLTVGLAEGARRSVLEGKSSDCQPSRYFTRIALLVFTGSWLAWYVFLSPGWYRYLFVPNFIGAIFVATWLESQIGPDGVAGLLRRARNGLRPQAKKEHRWAVFAVLVLASTVIPTCILLARSYVREPDHAAIETAAFINSRTPPDAVIEGYDMEVLALIDRPYHYPPDNIQLDLNRRFYFRQQVNVDYDPLSADPDLLLVGPATTLWGLYEPVLATGQFRLVRDFGEYQIYAANPLP